MYHQGGADMIPLVELGLGRVLNGDLLFTPTDIPLPPLKPARAVLYMMTGYDDEPGWGEQLRWVGAVRFSERESATVGASVVLEEHRHDLDPIGRTLHQHQPGLCRSFKVRHGIITGLTKLERQHASQDLGRYAALMLQDTLMRPGQTAPFDPLHEDMRPRDPIISFMEKLRDGEHPLFFNALLNRAAARATERAHGEHAVSRPLTHTRWYSGEYHDPQAPAKFRRMVSPKDAA
jgi:hypothetical protein